jgi:hypothetical protein
MISPPTINQAFDTLVTTYRRDKCLVDAFWLAYDKFIELYKIEPPYSSPESYKSATLRKMRVRRL